MSSLLKKYFFEPIVVSCYPQKIIFIFFVTYSFILTVLYVNTNSPRIFIDTPGYFAGKIEEPWSTVRTPGLRIYAKIIGANIGNNIIKAKLKKSQNIIDKELNKIVHANALLYTIAISSLVCTLCKTLPPIYVFLMLLGCSIAKIPNHQYILADQLAFIIIIIFLIFSIEFYRNRSLILLFLICLSAVYGFLVKPSCCFLSIIAFIICLFELLKEKFKYLFIKICILSFLIIGTLYWPFLLYMNGKIFAVSQLEVKHNCIFAMYFLQKGDEKYFKNDIDRNCVIQLIDQKNQYLQGDIAQTIKNYKKVRYMYWPVFMKVMKETYGKEFTLLERAALNKQICTTIVRKHKYEYVKHILASMKNSFTMDVSHIANFIHKKLHSQILEKYWFIISSILILCGVLVGYLQYNKDKVYSSFTRYIAQIICICASIHILHIFVTSIGHFVMTRYSEITEWAFLLSIYLSIYNCLYFIIKVVEHMYQASGQPVRRRPGADVAC